jgi:hypothetical protein
MIANRSRSAGGLRREDGLGAVVPSIVLLAGLAAVAVIVAAQSSLSPSALSERSGAAWGLYTVGNVPAVYARLPFSPFDAHIDHRSWGLTILLTLVYLGSVTAIGNTVVKAVRGSDSWPRPLSAVAGFLPGYVMVLAPLQLLFAAVPLSTAVWLALGGMPVTALMIHRRALSRFSTDLRRNRRPPRNAGLTVGGIIVLVVLAVVHRLQVDEFFLTQDSIVYFLHEGEVQTLGQAGRYLGQWSIQSDEWVFNAPLMFASHRVGDLWFPIYASQCAGLASFLSLVFGIVHRLAARRKSLAAGVAVVAIFGATFSIYPWLYVTSVAGGQPVVTVGHVGRHVGILAPWLALLLLGRQPRSVVIALAFATLGLGFTSVHNVLNVGAAIGAVLIWHALAARHVTWAPGRSLRAVAYLLPAVSVTAIVGAFWWLAHADTPASAAWWLVAGALVATAGAFAMGAATSIRAPPTTSRRSAAWGAAWLMAAVGGLVLANNLTDSLRLGGSRSLLATVLPGYGTTPLERGELVGGVLRALSFPGVSEPACAAFRQCQGIPDLLAGFGVLFVLVLVTWSSFGRLTADPATNARRAVLLILVAALEVGLVLTFFTGAESVEQGIIFSRFLEVPSYGLLALAAMAFAESRSRLTVAAGMAVLVLWSVIPLVATQWPEQMVRNAGWYLEHLGVL